MTITKEQVLQAVARGWCHEQNAYKTMDADLACAIADEVFAVYKAGKSAVSEPVAWRYTFLGTPETTQIVYHHFQLKPKPQGCIEDALYTTPPAEAKPLRADMFWNHDDAETLYDSIDEFLNDEICNGLPLEVGDTRTIQQAKRLPNIEIRITSIDEEACEAEWEVVEAAHGIANIGAKEQ